MPNINNLKRKDSFWLMVSEVSVHYGRENVAKQKNSCHGNQETEKEKGTGDQISPSK
jgi:hypothetical protein